MKIKRLLVSALIWILVFATFPAAAFASGEPLLALTFDDGPGPYTEQLLDILAEKGVKVTFFMLGQQAARYLDTVRRAAQEGHQLASHTYSHVNLKTLSTEGIRDQLQRTAAVLDGATGRSGQYMLRPPYGGVSDQVLAAIGTPAILWSVDPQDWKYRDAQTDHDNVLAAAGDGDIILMHDIHEESVAAIPSIIDDLQAQGYEFVTVSELLRRKGISPEAGKVYRSAPGETLYSSEEPILRGELVFELYKLCGSPKLSRAKPALHFKDLDSYHNAYAVRWAAMNSIVKGYPDASFRPNQAISREDFSVIYCRFARFLGRRTEGSRDLAEYPDGQEVSSYAQAPLSYMLAAGLLKTDSSGRVNPREYIGRTEAVNLLLSLKQ